MMDIADANNSDHPKAREVDLDNDDTEVDDIFTLIKSGYHDKVNKFLSEKGRKVDISPKIGCSPIHYSDTNPANRTSDKGDSLLTLATIVDSKMVEIVLNHGGNPNFTDGAGHTPLSIAATRNDKETINKLLLAGASLETTVVLLTSSLKNSALGTGKNRYGNQAGASIRPLTSLLEPNVYLKCKNPIKTAFCVDKEIKKIKDIRMEFKNDFERLIQEADTFACKFLDHCDGLVEARRVLFHPVDLLRVATLQEKKKFVAHPFCQQIINEKWNGEATNDISLERAKNALKYFGSPILLPLLFFEFLLLDYPKGASIMDSKFADLLRFMYTPRLCLLTDTLNYISLLVLLICVCVTPTNYHIKGQEVVLFVCLFSRILVEIDFAVQGGWRKYLRDFWNIADMTIIMILLRAGYFEVQTLLKSRAIEIEYLGTQKTTNNDLTTYREFEETLMEAHENSMRINYMYAIAQFILTLRVLGLLEISKTLGILLIALKYLIFDVIQFSILLLALMFGTSIAIFSTTIATQDWNEELEKAASMFQGYNFTLLPYPEKVEIPEQFKTFEITIRSILWSTFGMLDIEVGLFCEFEEGPSREIYKNFT